MKLAPKTLTGALHNSNKGACDWGWQGQLAYGCQNVVVVINPTTMQVFQTMDRHKGYVVKVKWAKENYHHDLASPYSLSLASADHNGKIIVWDVANASVRAEFSDSSKPVADMEWLGAHDSAHDMLAALHPPYSLILWNAATGTKLWKKTYTENLLTFAFDPFEPRKLAFLGQDCIVFVEDFSVSKVPSSNGKKFYISSPSQSNMSQSGSAEKLSSKSSKTTLTKKMSNILVGEQTKRPQDEEAVALNECVQLAYHQACRHHLILLYPRELLIIDLDINQTVGIIPMERTGSPFVQVLPLKQRDVIMTLHESGSIAVRVRRRGALPSPTPTGDTIDDSPTHASLEVAFDLRCQSDPLRITKNNRVFGLAYCPVSEMKLALVMSDSKVLLWELKTIDYQISQGSLAPQSPLYTPGTLFPSDVNIPAQGNCDPLRLHSTATYPRTALSDLIGNTQTFSAEKLASQNKHGVLFRFMLTGLLNGVATTPTVVKMCPPLTTKNWAIYQPLLAIGTSLGLVQIYNLSSGMLTQEFSIHTSTVRGIEWVSLHSFLTFANPTPGSNGLVKNEIFFTDIQTGKSTPFRPNREEESPIDVIRISYLKQYFVIVFRDKPFELWDLRTGSLLRQMSKNFPHVTALEWSPSHNLKSLKKKLQQSQENLLPIGSQSAPDMSASSTSLDSKSDSRHLLHNVAVREHFVFTDSDGLLYLIIVEGNVIKDGSRIPPDGGMGSITCIAWKGDTLVLGDVDGNLNLWDLKARVSRAVPTHRGWIKKLKFAPGRGNMKLVVLYNDGVDVWEAKELELLSSLKTPKDIPKASDVDWAASDKLVFSCADGCVRVMDLKFRTGSSPMEDHQLAESVFCPHLLPPKAALTVKSLLQHQPWNGSYKLGLAETDENADISTIVNEQLDILDSEIKEYLPQCHFGTAQRCLLTARLFGDESELTFWTVALHYLRAEKAGPMSKSVPRSSSATGPGDLFVPSTPARETRDLLVFDDKDKEEAVQSGWSFIKDRSLETCYDVLCDNQTFQSYQLERISLHDTKRTTYMHTSKCAENLMLLGEADRAVQLLLETESDNQNYYEDCLRACLVASIRSSGASQSTIKLVATNLIANGKLSEGVQLLCLIDKGMDACRYLQTYGEWYQASWLAKATLDYSECAEVMKRWVDHLSSPHVNQRSKAVLVLLSLGQFTKVIELLYSMRWFDTAACFAEAIQEFGLLVETEETLSLLQAVFLEYARLLLHLGHRQGAEFYCRRAGDRGQQLLKEIDHAFNK